MFNEMAGYPKKFLRATNSSSIKYYMQKYGIGKTDAEALMNWRIELDRQQMNKAMDVLGLGLSVGATVSPPAIAIRLGLAALAIDAAQPDIGGVLTGAAALPHYKAPPLNYGTAALDIGYGIWQVFK